MSPRSSQRHQWAIATLVAELNSQLPHDLVALPETEVAITAGPQPTVRVPDILVTRFDLVEQGARFTGTDISLVIEVVSPGSRSTDRVLRAFEYARAGIGAYWIVDLDAMTISVLENVDGVYITRTEGPHAQTSHPRRFTSTSSRR